MFSSVFLLDFIKLYLFRMLGDTFLASVKMILTRLSSSEQKLNRERYTDSTLG